MQHLHLRGYLRCSTDKQVEIVQKYLGAHAQESLENPGCYYFNVTPVAGSRDFFVEEHFADHAALEEHRKIMANGEWANVTSEIIRDYEIDEVNAPIPYQPDYEWLWDGEEVKTLRALILTQPQHRDSVITAIDTWLSSFKRDNNGLRFSGGWSVSEVKAQFTADDIDHLSIVKVIDITSGGEDVADSIQDGAYSLYTVIKEFSDTEIIWIN